MDIGGTFTDFAVVTGSQTLFTKVPSTPHDPGAAVMQGLEKIHRVHGISPEGITRIVQGTTVSTNAVLEKRGAHTALITNRGFEDVLEIGRQNRSNLPGEFPIYDLHLTRPDPLVSRRHRLGVRGRISRNGGEIEPLSEDDVRTAADRAVEAGAESVAVCFLGSYLDPQHEQRAAQIIRERHPQLEVTASCEVLPEFREYERTSTTVISAYLKPVLKRYLTRLADSLREVGVRAPMGVMQSNGGITTLLDAGERAAHTVLSGPAGGVQGARYTAAEIEAETGGNLLTLDIGGTSTDLSLVVDGSPARTSERNVGGHPLRTPMVDVNTIGRGGGSVVRLDPAGGLQVGPDSAGADPGPVCYGRGGELPTLTDAHLLLGHLNPETRLGEEISLHHRASREVFASQVARPMGLPLEEAAQGAVDITIAEMKRAAGVISTDRGHDPRDFTLVAFGGAGPMYGMRLAREMDIPRVLIPPGPGVLSALGLLSSDVRHDFVQSNIAPLRSADRDQLEQSFAALRREAEGELTGAGFEPEEVTCDLSLDLRYQGQSYELEVELGSFRLHEDVSFPDLFAGAEAAEEQFHCEHERTYGHSAPDEPVQLVNLRLAARGTVRKPGTPRPEVREDHRPRPETHRPVHFSGEGFLETPVFSRASLPAGSHLQGPAVIEEAVSTTLVPPGFSVQVDRSGNLLATDETPERASGGAEAADNGVDPVTLQVLRRAFIAATEEMGMTLRRTGYSPNIKEREDCSTALFDANCRIIAQADYPMQPGHLGAMIYSVQEAVRAFPAGSLQPGDVIIQNDPHRGGNHLPDITLITPIFYRDRLRGFAANRAHHADVGGAVPGSIYGKSTEIYQEGFIIPPLKLYEAGRPNRAILELLRANVRTPDERTGDLRAQMAANEKGRSRMLALYSRYGEAVLEGATEELVQYSEARMRHEIEQIPDGSYSFSDWMDDDGVTDDPVEIAVTVTVEGSDITFDFTGSAGQTLGPINTTEAITAGTVFYTLRCLTDPSIPPNSGCYEPVRVIAPRGTVVNPEPPAAVVGGNLETAQRLVDVLIGALSGAVPDRVVAACNGQMCNVGLGGPDPREGHEGQRYAYYETIGGGFGARLNQDGIDGIHCHMTNTMNTPVEAIEVAYPFIITHYSLIPDSGGPGRQRGGLGIRRDYQILDHHATFSLLAERRKTRPYGIFGGRQARCGRDIIDPCTETAEVIPGKHTLRLTPGRIVSIRTPGGGGYGDPLERDPRLVLRDVLQGRISRAHARDEYGVVVVDDEVDQEKTTQLREQMMA